MTYPGTVPEYINQGNGHVLIVEKDTLQGHLLKVYLQEAGWVVRLATGPTEALAFCTYDLFDLAILNFTYLEDVDGFVLANLLYEQYQLPSLMITAARYIELSRCPAFSSDQDVLFKPYQLSECHRRLKRLFAGTPRLREHQVNHPPKMHLLRFCFLLLALLMVTPLIGQSATEQLEELLQLPRDTQQVNQVSQLVSDLVYTGEIVPDSLFDLAVEAAAELKDTSSLIDINLERTVYYLNTGQVEKGLVNVEEIIRLAPFRKGGETLDNALELKIELLLAGGYTTEAAQLATKLAKQYDDAGNSYSQSIMYQILSTISATVGDYALTIKYDSIAIALAEQSNYVDVITPALYTAADNYLMLGKPEKSLPLAEEALKIVEEYELEYELGNVLNVRMGANTALRNFTAALEDYKVLEQLEGEQQFSWWMISRGVLLQQMERHDEARKLLLVAETVIKESSNSALELKRCYEALQLVGLNKTQYDTVTKYSKLIQAELDSLQTAKNIRSLLELEKKYKADEKDAEILLQKEQLSRQRSELTALILGFLFALAAGLGFYSFNRKLRRRNTENEQLLVDKETLIGEIHHRVKNNLQVVSSLLQLQRRGLASGDDKGRAALLESENRVSAMGLIHNKLYQGEAVTSVLMPEYLEDLGNTLLDAYRLEEQVEIYYDVEDIVLDVDLAIPLGLIINELVTNSLKYAFPQGREGTLEIALHYKQDDIELIVADDGVGAAAAEKRKDSTSFGSNLIGLLSKKLKGELHILPGEGYAVSVTFPAKKVVAGGL